MSYFKKRWMVAHGMSCRSCANYVDGVGLYPKCLLSSQRYIDYKTGEPTLYSDKSADECMGTRRCRYRQAR